MPRPPAKIIVERVNKPDLDLAAGAILPLFLAFLDSRAARQASPEGAPPPIEPARADEACSLLPP